MVSYIEPRRFALYIGAGAGVLRLDLPEIEVSGSAHNTITRLGGLNLTVQCNPVSGEDVMALCTDALRRLRQALIEDSPQSPELNIYIVEAYQVVHHIRRVCSLAPAAIMRLLMKPA